MPLLIAAAASASLVSACDDSTSRDDSYSTVEAATPSAPVVKTPEALPDRPPLPDHNYDERRGWNYYYVAAISDEDRAKGRAAGEVLVYQYLGLNDDGHHVLASMRTNGTVSHTASCSSPCRIIDFSYGGNSAYTPQSIIGAAFQDAMRGKLRVADWANDDRVEPVPSTAPAPRQDPIPSPSPEPANDEPWEMEAPAADEVQE
jgi:hypothetical protein